MPQGVLPYKYEEEKNDTGMTALAGLPVYLDLAHVIGLSDSIGRHMHVRGAQGWTDEQVLESLILLNLAGGDCVEDSRRLEKDEGFCRVLRRVELKGLSRKERREQERRWRKERRRTLPSQSAVFRYLEAFHDAEQEMILYTEFRDGNVPAGYEQLRVFKEALEFLPEGVKKVRLRSDTAGYQHDLLKYCELRKDERFGRIEFAIGCDVTKEFKKAVAQVEESDWKPIFKEVNGTRIKTGSEWAEVCFVPNAIGHSKKGPEYRYLATREALQMDIPGMELQRDLPFQTLKLSKQNYKIFGAVTNMDWEGEALIHWQHARCGKSEEAHAVMKEDLAGGKLPSGQFGENAAWWWIMILALNLNALMKRLALRKSWVSKRMKAMRFSFINLPGRVLEHARNLIVRLAKGHPSLEILLAARSRIMELMVEPSG